MSQVEIAGLVRVAREAPDRPAIIMTRTREVMTYAELNARSDALAGQLRAAGLNPGDHVAILLENRPEFMVAVWAAHRSGLYYTPVNWHLTADEVRYIIEDCGASIVLTSEDRWSALSMLAPLAKAQTWLCSGGGASGFAPTGGPAPEPAPYEPIEGQSMIYSSGTSGQPKGIKRPPTGAPFGEVTSGDHMVRSLYDWNEDVILLNTAPLYHAGPLNFAMSTHRCGGTVAQMSQFEPGDALLAIQDLRVNRIWLVPTMMIRLLKHPGRESFDVTSVAYAIHSAAPCPREIKHAMMDWWGPVLYEFYGATEGNGLTAITPQEWLAHPGSVGRSSEVRIVGDDGEVLPQGEVGTIYFATAWNQFEYHNDSEKTAETRDHRGWTTVGDMGYLDEDGYLYLTDRKTNMIIAGGVNIYPQEAENVLSVHPAVQDVAVIGVPHPEYGEEVRAVVELADGFEASDALAAELVAWCTARLARYKCPRTVDFATDLPRLPNGKLLKREVKARYWGEGKVRV